MRSSIGQASGLSSSGGGGVDRPCPTTASANARAMTVVMTRKRASPTRHPGSCHVLLISHPSTKPAVTIHTSFILTPCPMMARWGSRSAAHRPGRPPDETRRRNTRSRAAAVLIERIDDASDPRLADYQNLRDPLLRLQRGIFMAESPEVVRRLLSCPRLRTRSILVTPAALDGLSDLLDTVDASVRILLVEHDLVRRVVGFNFHRGCVAVGERGAEPSPASVIEPSGRRLLIVLEDVTNPDNVGAVFRNATPFGADGVLLSPGCADPLYRKSIRVSIGSSLCLPFARLAG